MFYILYFKYFNYIFSLIGTEIQLGLDRFLRTVSEA